MKFPFSPAYLGGCLIFIVATLPGPDLQKLQQSSDNPVLRFLISDPFMHFLIFGILTFLICYGYHKAGSNPLPFIKIGLIGIGYGLFIEIYQGMLPWRTFELDDLLWNIVGVIFATSGFYLGHEIN